MTDIKRYLMPRAVEDSPHAEAVHALLAAQTNNLCELRGIKLDASVQTVLQRALRTGRLTRGFETALEKLENERRGLAHLQRTTGKQQTARVSRLILISSDSSERLRSEIERACERHAPRVLALDLAADSARIGRLLFGADSHAKVLLLDHKEAVAGMLIAASQQKGKRTDCSVGSAEL